MDDNLYALYEDIWTKVHALVNGLTGDLSPEDDEELRQHLTETFTFWRRG